MSDRSTVAMDWDTYWRGSADGTAFGSEGVDHPAVRQFWVEALSSLARDGEQLRLLDVASGRGAVVDIAQSVFGEDGVACTCLDASRSAIKSLIERFPRAEGVVGDVREMPFAEQRFDIVTSQFGVEYAGLDAVEEMLRVLAPGGAVVLLMHLKGSIIDDECAANIRAINDLQGIGFLPAATRIFAEGRKCLRGETGGLREEYDAAVRDMMPIFRDFRTLLETHGEGAAGGTLATLYHDTDRIYGRIMHHDLDEVLQWLERMGDELLAYEGRMQSMCDAAHGAADFELLARQIADGDFTVSASGPLRPDADGQDVAWQLVARKEAQ